MVQIPGVDKLKSPSELNQRFGLCRADGQSLVSVMIGMAVMGVSMLAFTSMLSGQQKETRALTEKLASLDFSRTITSILANPATCSALLGAANVVGGTSTLTFDATSVTSNNPKVIGILKIAGVGGGEAVSPMAFSLIVNATNGFQLNVVSPTAANLLVNFDQTKLVRPLKSLSFSVALQSAGPVNNTTITGCAAGGGVTYETAYHCHTIRLHPPGYAAYYSAADFLNAYGNAIPAEGQGPGQPGNVQFYGTIFYPSASYPNVATANTIVLGNNVDQAWLQTLGYRHGVFSGYAPATVSGMTVELVQDNCTVVY